MLKPPLIKAAKPFWLSAAIFPMKAFYLHGYDSTGLTAEKEKALKSLGLEVVAPRYIYPDMTNILPDISRQLATEQPDMLIGSSMGGRLAFYLANGIRLPALLFNPALVHAMIDERHPISTAYRELPLYPHQQFVLGAQDETVPYRLTLEFMEEYYPDQPIYHKLLPELEHGIPVEVFENQAGLFLERYFG